MKPKILIVDDDISVLKALERFFTTQNYETLVCSSLSEAKRALAATSVDLALVDLNLGEENGIELITHLHHSQPDAASIIMTGFGSIDSAVEAIKAGAFHYVVKPFELADVGNLVQKALDHQQACQEIRVLKKQLSNKYSLDNIVGISESMKEVFEMIDKVAETDSTVLVLGESGTGKELVAHAIHHKSKRAMGPLVAVNCAAIPEELLESELFGHSKGAFTGAIAAHVGRFEMAHQGTIFLDEIGDMSPKLQVKLLRVLQERHIEPVGSNRSIDVDVRIIAATNKNLEDSVKSGKFREDLFYRLNVIPIKIPALRERKSDIPILVQHFLHKFSQETGFPAPRLSEESMTMLCNYVWPGNVRELENMIERLVILKPGQAVNPGDFPEKLIQQAPAGIMTEVKIPDNGISFKKVVNSFENELILKALEKTSWNKNRAASLLRLNRTTLVEKIKRRQLEKTILS